MTDNLSKDKKKEKEKKGEVTFCKSLKDMVHYDNN